jgi:hypothetical protein
MFAADADNPYLRVIPADKKLDPAWVKSLFERGEKEVYRSDAAMQHMGMPVGGIFSGTLYLSADGRLWHWNRMASRRSRSFMKGGRESPIMERATPSR